MTPLHGLSLLASSNHLHFTTAFSGGHWAVSGTSAAPVSCSSFDGPIEMFGTALSVFRSFQFKPQQRFHANSTLTFASYLLQTQLKDLYFTGGLGSFWEILSLLLLPQHEAKLAVSP